MKHHHFIIYKLFPVVLKLFYKCISNIMGQNKILFLFYYTVLNPIVWIFCLACVLWNYVALSLSLVGVNSYYKLIL